MLADRIRQQLYDAFEIDDLKIVDESHKHAGHAQSTGGHFKLLIISNYFEGKSLIDRHKAVYSAMGRMMKNEIHALSIKAVTPSEIDPNS